jgi:hypothetical protein
MIVDRRLSLRGRRLGPAWQYRKGLYSPVFRIPMRVPTKPAMHSNLKPAGYSDRKPATLGVNRMGRFDESLRDEKVKWPIDLERVAFAF